ncbi:response regulator [Methylobacterium sp. CM6247]
MATYGFVKQSEGGIRIDTVIGEGTSIRVYLPRVASETEPLPKARRQVDCAGWQATGGKAVLLVIDDDTEVREVTATRLSEAGHEIREAGSGLAGLAALEADPCVDLVVLDFAMPGMNGAEVAVEIRKRWPGMQILFVTGYADTITLMKVGSVGVEGIVQKPFRDGELESKVIAALNSRVPTGLRLVSSGTAGD